jgi:hypothetical protein
MRPDRSRKGPGRCVLVASKLAFPKCLGSVVLTKGAISEKLRWQFERLKNHLPANRPSPRIAGGTRCGFDRVDFDPVTRRYAFVKDGHAADASTGNFFDMRLKTTKIRLRAREDANP